MGVGPNYVLDKGFLAKDGAVAYKAGEVVAQTADGIGIIRATTADAPRTVGIVQENIDANKVGTGKAVLGVRLLGISRAIAGGAIAVGDPLTNDTSARVVKQTTAGGPAFAKALTPATAAGDMIDVLLTPNVTI